MKRLDLLLFIVSILLIGSCAPRERDEPEAPVPTTISIIGEATGTALAEQPTSVSQSPTLTPTVSAPLPNPSPTISDEAAVTMPATSTHAVIHLFHVFPFQSLQPGDDVLIVWEFEGDNGRICAVIDTGPTDCFEVSNRGEQSIIVQDVSEPYWLVLYVNVSDFPNAEQIATANLYVGCEHTWFFDQPEAAVCPESAPQSGMFAAQSFEHGTMIWIDAVGRYYGLVDVSSGHGALFQANDPLTIQADTSADVTAPSGLYAPASGFGLVWRGDADVYPDWREALGWGLVPEFNYAATFQCDHEVPKFQFCYLTQPDGWLAVLHPLGNWYAKSVSFLSH